MQHLQPLALLRPHDLVPFIEFFSFSPAALSRVRQSPMQIPSTAPLALLQDFARSISPSIFISRLNDGLSCLAWRLRGVYVRLS